MKKSLYILLGILTILTSLLISCNSNQRPGNKRITVTIPPLKGLIEDIVGDDFQINILLPEGASPETYSPSMSQIAELEESEMVFFVGTLPFEDELINNSVGGNHINLSKGVKVIDGHCNHHTHTGHHHSMDPHIWISLDELSTIVDNIDNALMTAYPDSTKYHANCQAIKAKLEDKKQEYQQMLKDKTKDFLIYHPALGYLANTLGLNQIAIENEGKSPTPATLSTIIDKVRKENIKVMLYQREYPIDIVQPVADILDVNLVEINPLNTDIIDEIDRVINILASDYEQ